MQPSPFFLTLLGLSLASPAFAENPPPPKEDVPGNLSLQDLQTELDAAKKDKSKSAAEIKALTEIIDAASILLDHRFPPAARTVALQRLADQADPRAIKFIWAASHAQSAEVRGATITVATRWEHADAVDLLARRADSTFETAANRTAAIEALGKSKRPAAADALYKLSMDKAVIAQARAQAIDSLKKYFPDYLKDKLQPSIAGDPAGTVSAIAGSALTGGIMLGSVGEWGQGEAAVAIGSLGGAGIGAGTAALYLRSSPASAGQGIRYASNVAWGLAGGMMASQAIYANQGMDYDHQEREIDNRNMSALLRTVGVGIGAGTGFARRKHNPTFRDVMEVNAAGILGSQLGRSTASMMQSLGRSTQECDAYYVDGMEAALTTCRSEEWHRENRESRVRSGITMAGSALGLAVGTITKDKWNPSGQDALFSSVVAAETMVVAGLLPGALGSHQDPDSFVDLAAWSGLTAGMFYTHHRPVTYQQTALIGYGVLAGNGLGVGIGSLPGKPLQEKTREGIIIPAGIGGAALGAWSSSYLKPSQGDWTMVGVGTALTAAEIGAITFVLDEHDVLKTDEQIGGIILTGTTLASAGFMAATKALEPEPIDSMFMGSAASWGAFYGSVGQVAIDTDLDDPDAVLVTTLAADVGLGLGGWILSDKSSITPRSTLVPQLFGLTGATLGSLGVMLATEKGQPIAIGAVTGATAGFGLGAALAPKLARKQGTARAPLLILPRPRIDPPGHWTFSALPAVTQDGHLGAALQLTGFGF